MANLLLIDDSFSRANTAAGTAGTSTGGGNGWVDAKGNVWSIQAGKLQASDATGNFRYSWIYRPVAEGCRDQIITVDWQAPGSTGATGQWGPILRVQAGNFYLAFFNPIDTTNGNGNGSIGIFAVTSGGATVTQIGASSYMTTLYNPAHAYEITFSATGTSPTALVATVTDVTAGTLQATVATSDSTSGLQTTNATSGVTVNGSNVETFTRVRTYDQQSSAVAVSDSNLFLTGNWVASGSTYVQSAQAGAYVKTGFTGTAVNVNVDTTPLSGGGVSVGNYPLVGWSVDGGPWQTAQLTAGQTAVPCAAGLAAGTHQLVFETIATGGDDQWTVPSNVVRITGFTLDTGATTAAPTLAPNRLLYFGDSITNGTRVLGTGFNAFDHDIRYSPAFSQAAYLNAEVTVVGFGGQGWAVAGSSNVPAFSAAWNSHDSTHSRLVSAKITPVPTHVIIDQGENDYEQSVTSATVQAAITSTLTAIRAALPTTAPVFVRVPRSGGQRAAITAGVAATADPKTMLIDLGPAVQTGLTSLTLDLTGSQQSVDKVHPYAFTNIQIEPLASAAIALLQAAVATSSTANYGPPSLNSFFISVGITQKS